MLDSLMRFSFVSLTLFIWIRTLVACLKSTFRQFHQRKTGEFFVRIFWQSQNVTRKMTFVRKIRTFNVDEIDT